MPLQPHLLKDKEGRKTANEEHSICVPGGLQGALGSHGKYTVRGPPLIQILNHCQTQPACNLIALLLLASAVLTWGSTARREKTFPQDRLIGLEHCLSKSPTSRSPLPQAILPRKVQGIGEPTEFLKPGSPSLLLLLTFIIISFFTSLFSSFPFLLHLLAVYLSICPCPPAAEPTDSDVCCSSSICCWQRQFFPLGPNFPHALHQYN